MRERAARVSKGTAERQGICQTASDYVNWIQIARLVNPVEDSG